MKTILVVDDEVDIARTLQWYLEHSGYAVVVAHDGRDALAKAIEYQPDLIVTDIMMPRMDGYELIQQIKATPGTEGIPIIAMSARDGIGYQPFFRKPFDPSELTHIIEKLLQD